jgi:hypothetical protein
MQDQARLLEELPGALAETIRDELAREIEADGVEVEPAEPGAAKRLPLPQPARGTHDGPPFLDHMSV